jgi:SAM-dependent methyltransferase
VTEFSSFIYSGKAELEKLEANLQNYNKFIVSSFTNHAGPRAKNILDFGAGIGTLSNIWRNLRADSKIACLEVDKAQHSILVNRGFFALENLPNEMLFDYIFTSNVLEHIEDDQKTLDKLFTTLNSGGGIGIFVPANRFIYSITDTKLGHFRRYSKKELINKVSRSGFKIDLCVYVDSLGFFAWLFLKIFKIGLNDSGSVLLPIYDKFIWPLSKLLDNLGLKYMFGKNLLLLAKKP